MPTADRYFSETPILGDNAILSGPEAHHLIHVMRGSPGERVTLFDGSGAEFTTQIEQVGRSEVKLAVIARHEANREMPMELILGVALPKGDRQKWLVEKAVELGVTRLVPLKTARSVAQPVEQALARLQRSVIEASKQCGRNCLMEITGPQYWADLVAATADVSVRLLAHPGSRARDAKLPDLAHLAAQPVPSAPVVLAIGPEGGFTSEEVALALSAGWCPVDLGPRILRIETAALLLIAMVAQAVLRRD